MCCQACASEISAGEEICSHCFAPTAQPNFRYTSSVETTAGPAVAPETPTMTLSRRIPDLDTITYKPSSSVYRAVNHIKGGAMSALVALMVVAAVGGWWVQSHRATAAEHDALALRAFEQKEYEVAVKEWDTAIESYRKGYSSTGRAEALFQKSRSQTALKQYDEALASLQKSQKLEQRPEFEESIQKCHRLKAVAHLEQSQELFGAKDFGKAYLEAELAIKEFDVGLGSEAQRAGAYRMASRCSLKLEDFEGSDALLAQAVEIEGNSKQNAVLDGELKRAYALHRKQLLADSANNRYIPDSKIDPLSLPQPIRHSPRYPATESKTYNRTYSGRLLSGIPSRSPLPPRANLGGGTSYPTADRYEEPSMPSGSFSSSMYYARPTGTANYRPSASSRTRHQVRSRVPNGQVPTRLPSIHTRRPSVNNPGYPPIPRTRTSSRNNRGMPSTFSPPTRSGLSTRYR